MNVIVFGIAPVSHHTALTANGVAAVASMDGRYTGALSSFFLMFLVLGVQSIGRSLPFGLTLGVSRRSYYTGTALLAVLLACADGLALTALQAIERATDGWGVNMGFFRVPYLLDGPWYQTWLTSFVGLALLFVYGMWFGIVYRRWGLFGMLTFIAAQVTVLLGAGLVITWAHGWTGVGHFFTGLTVAGLTGLLAVLAAALLAAATPPSAAPPSDSGRAMIPIIPLPVFPYQDRDSLFGADLRASDADRDVAADILCAAVADGRLTLAELEERLEEVLSARTLREIARVMSDLPSDGPPASRLRGQPAPIRPAPVRPAPVRPAWGPGPEACPV